MVLPTVAMYWLKNVEHGVLESAGGGAVSCDKCKSWLVTRSDLVSHHTSLHKQACNIGREWVIGSEGHVEFCFVFFLFEYYCDNCKISLKNKNNLDSHQSSSHAAMNYSFVSMDENPTFRLWIWFSNFSLQTLSSYIHIDYKDTWYSRGPIQYVSSDVPVW